MKILFLTPWYPDEKRKNHGIFVRDQAAALAEAHEVMVLSSKVNYEKFGLRSFRIEESFFGKVKEYRLEINRSLPFYNQLNYFLISTRAAVKIAKAFKPDIIHGNIGYPGGFWSWLVSRRIGKPFVITEHTFIYNNFRSFLHKKLTVFPLRRAGGVITVSNKARTAIKKYVNVEVTVIPNIVDTNRYSIAPFPGGLPAIGFLGGLTSPQHVKGLDTLLRTVSKIKKDFVLHIGGTGSMVDQYKSMASQLGISDKCKFLDYVSDVPAFMNRLHFFVNSSRFESFGIAIVEAMAAGLPVVCYNNGGPADFVDSFNGVLVADQNEEELKKAIEWMLDNYASFDRGRIHNSATVKFSIEAFKKRMNEVYLKVVCST